MGTAVGRVLHHERRWLPAHMAWPWARAVRRSAALRAQLHLTRGEHLLIQLAGTDGGRVVGTDRALYWSAARADWVRLGWEEIAWAQADPATDATVVMALPAGVPWRVALPVPGGQALLSLAEERVAATRFTVTHIAVGGRQFRVEGRRQPATGQIHWLVRLDHDLDPDDPAVRDQIAHAVGQLRGALGV